MVNYENIRAALVNTINTEVGVSTSKGLTIIAGPRFQAVLKGVISKLTVAYGNPPTEEVLIKGLNSIAFSLAQPWGASEQMVDMIYKAVTDVATEGDFRDENRNPEEREGDHPDDGDGDRDGGQNKDDDKDDKDSGQDKEGQGEDNDSPARPQFGNKPSSEQRQREQDNKKKCGGFSGEGDGQCNSLTLGLWVNSHFASNDASDKSSNVYRFLTTQFPVGGENGMNGVSTIVADDLYYMSCNCSLPDKFSDRREIVEDALMESGFYTRMFLFMQGIPVNPMVVFEDGSVLAPTNMSWVGMDNIYVIETEGDSIKDYELSTSEDGCNAFSSAIDLMWGVLGGERRDHAAVLTQALMNTYSTGRPFPVANDVRSIKMSLKPIYDEEPDENGEDDAWEDIDIPDFGDGWIAPYWFQDLLKCLCHGYNVFLKGDRGLGKSEAVLHAGMILQKPVFSITSPQNRSDVTGFTDANGVFRPSPIISGCMQNSLTFVDEFDRSWEEAVIAMNPILANGVFTGADGSNCRVHEDCLFVVAGNTSGMGANSLYNTAHQLDASTLDRFVVIECGIDKSIQIKCATRRNGKVNFKAIDFINAFSAACKKAGFLKMVPSYRGLRDFVGIEELCKDSLKAMRMTILRESLQKEELEAICENLKGSNFYIKTLKDFVESMPTEEE